jgi:hypothetical protein
LAALLESQRSGSPAACVIFHGHSFYGVLWTSYFFGFFSFA